MNPLSITVPVTIRAAEGDSPVRRFEMVAYTGEPMRIDGFPLPVVIDCASLDNSVQTLPALFNHGAECPVGQIQSVTCDGTPPIRAAGVFTPSGLADDRAAEVINRADAGYRWQVSIGGNPASVEQYQRGESFQANGRTYQGPALLAKGVKLREISFVTIGGDSLTSAVVAGSTPTLKGAQMDFATWVAALGFDEASLTDQQRAALTIKFTEEQADMAEDTAETPADMPVTAEDGMVKPEDQMPANAGARKPVIQASNHAEVQAELQRITAIQAAAKKYGNPVMTLNGTRIEVAAHAIAEGWTPAQAEIQAMRSQLRTPPSNLQVRAGASTQALEAGLILRCGGALDSKAYAHRGAVDKLPGWLRAGINDANRNRVMEEGHRFSKLSAVDLCQHALRAAGKPVPFDRDEMIRAAFSTPSFNNVITTSMNAMLMLKYVEAADTTGGWVVETDVANYLTQERSRVTATKGLSRQPEGAEADHIAPDDLKETYKVARYGSQLVVDEIAIVNDSLGAFAEEAGSMGLAAARLRPDLVYGTLLANPTLAATSLSLFSASNETANLLTSSALSASTLATARKTMALIRENGVNLGLVMTHLIVPPSLGDTAYNLVASQLQLITSTSGTADRTTGELNALKRHNFALVEEPRLENGVIHPETGTSYSGSATTWFTASSQAPSLEVGYLQGTGRSPQSRTWQLTGGSYGVGWAVKHVIGICPRDWRGLQKVTA